MHRRALLSAVPLLLLGACAYDRPAPRPRTGPYGGVDIGYSTWRDDEPAYRLYPGDQVDVTMPSAPELNRSLTLGPDGRISMPLIGAMMAADLAPAELEQRLSAAYASQLNDPRAEVSLKAAVPLRVFVGGEVGKAGVYDMPGDIDALQAVIMAGGFLPTGDPHRSVLIRRGAGNRPMMRMIDFGSAVHHAPAPASPPLRRFDIVYVPRTGVANVGLFVQQYLVQTMPVQFSYATGAGNYLLTR
jgi:polysaccharide export outer membrane protein